MELLLKARLQKDGANDARVIRVYEPRRTNAGKLWKKMYLRRNRAGNALTVSLAGCVLKLDKNAPTRLPPEVKLNLDALIAIRDSVAHYINVRPVLAKQVPEVTSAKNFITLAKA